GHAGGLRLAAGARARAGRHLRRRAGRRLVASGAGAPAGARRDRRLAVAHAAEGARAMSAVPAPTAYPRAGEVARSHATPWVGLAGSFLLGGAFLALQAVEYSHKPFSPQANAYAALFFTITGLHGAHVLAGLLMNAVVQVRVWLGHFTAQRHLAVQNVGLYWH